MIGVTLRGLLQRRLRTILTAMAVVLGVAMVSAAFTVSATMRSGADSLSAAAYDGTDAVLGAPSTIKRADVSMEHTLVPASLVDRARRVPGVATAVGDVTQQAKIIDGKGKVVGSGPFFGIGIDSHRPAAARLTPFHLVGGHWATGPGQVVVDQGTAASEHYAVGDSVRIAGSGPVRRYRVSGIARFGTVKTLGTATVAIFDLGTAQAVLGQPGRYDDVLVKGRPGVSPVALRARLAAVLGPGVKVQSAAAHDRFTLDGLKQFISIIKVVLLIFGIISIVVGGATILNAMSITVAQRSRELALLRTLGAERRDVRRSVLFEAALIGTGASIVGIGAGFGLARLLTSALAALGLDLPQSGMAFSASTAIVAAAVGIAATLLAAVVPARRATRVSPIRAMREDGGEAAARGPVRRGIARVVAGLVSVLGRPGERLTGPAGMLARRNAMRNPGRTAATAAALAIGVTLVVAVATLSAALTSATSGQAKAATGSSLVLADSQWGPFDAAAATALDGAPGVRAVAPLHQAQGRAFGKKIGVDGVDPKAAAGAMHYRWKTGSAATLAGLHDGTALVSEKFADAHGLRVGGSFTVRTPDGRAIGLTVAGIVERPALNPLALGDVTIAEPAFAAAFPAQRIGVAFVDAPGVAPSALASRLSGYPGIVLRTPGQYADHVAGVWAQLLAIFDVLLGLAVIVSLFGIVNTLILSVLERTREIGLLRAAGMSRRQVRRMVRQESIITALVGAALGIAVGLALGALATALLPIEGLSVSIPSGSIIATVVVAVVSGILAAAMPARRAARMDVLAAVSQA